jgi:hypothetical protein
VCNHLFHIILDMAFSHKYIQGGAGIFGPEGSEICISCKTADFCYFHIKLRHVTTSGINFHFMQ